MTFDLAVKNFKVGFLCFCTCVALSFLSYRSTNLHFLSFKKGFSDTVKETVTSNISIWITTQSSFPTTMFQLEKYESTGFTFKTKKCFQITWNVTDKLLRHIANKNCNFLTANNLVGRTGNQLFQTASVIGLAYKNDLFPIIRSANPISKTFDLPNRHYLKLENPSHIGPHLSSKYATAVEDITSDKNWTISGHLQCFRYFNESRDILKSVFRIHPEILNTVTAFLNTISKPDTQNVCVHVRRGDFTSEELKKHGYTVANVTHIKQAMRYYKRKFSKVQFVVLSDDIKWCKGNIKRENAVIHFSPFTTVSEDMALMTQCNHVALTSGTFGWWGGWLSGGTTLYFTDFPAKGSKLEKSFNFSDYYPKDWLGYP